MLLQIRDFLRQAKIASNQQIAREFGLEIEALEPMLACWLRKKVIGLYADNSACKRSCSRCNTANLIYYQFLLDN